MITDEQLNEWRVSGTKVRIVRDVNESNDVVGIVVAWDAETVMIRKQNRKVVKLSRSYVYQKKTETRPTSF